MGVHGLTTYLRENKRVLSKTFELPSNGTVSIVVDGWSFIYGLHYNSNLPWVYGGEYEEFSRLVCVVVDAWIKVGFKVYFVFDGACPELKFPTVISRLSQSHIQPSLLFFRTSPVSRATSRFLNETRIIPPLSYATCIHALEKLRQATDALEIHYADEEGDPYAVELAGRIGGYVVGNDSDFVVLNSEGYLGYIPLDEMVWHIPSTDTTSSLDGDDVEFQMVRKPKAKKKAINHPTIGRGLLPPDPADRTKLSFTSYNPQNLASHINIPVTLLPLLGALVGNDFSSQSESNKRNAQSLFFDRQLSSSQRIERVANTIRSVLSPTSQKRKFKHQVGSVMDLIDRTVNALLARLITTMGSGEIESIVDKIVESTLQYAIPRYEGDVAGNAGLWITDVCALHHPDSCPFLPMISRKVAEESEEPTEHTKDLLNVRSLYLEAYRNGQLFPKSIDILSTGSSWARLFLENPDLETVSRSIGRPIRQWVYAILDDAIGLPTTEEESTSIPEEPSVDDSEESDGDEIVDVVESDDEDSTRGDDFLAPLKGELQRLRSDDEATEPPASVVSRKTSRSGDPSVIEYLRRGTRIAQEPLKVTPLPVLLSSIIPNVKTQDTTPLLLRNEEERLTVFLRLLGSDLASIRALPQEQLIPVLAVRWVVHCLHARASETGSKDREKERWTKTEARCFLASLPWAMQASLAPSIEDAEVPTIVDRNVQLMAQLLMALESIEQLAQVLMLVERAPSPAHLLSGKLFHSYLTGMRLVNNCIIPPHLIDSVMDGLEEAFQEERTKKIKKERKEKPLVSPVVQVKGVRNASGSLFSMLGDVEA